MFKRIGLFILTNLAILVMLSIILNLVSWFFGVDFSQIAGAGQNYGSLLIFAAVIGFSGSIISLMNADFDGDQCNVFRIFGLDLGKRFAKALNPRYNMYISRMTGKFERKMLPIKDEVAAFWAMNNI